MKKISILTVLFISSWLTVFGSGILKYEILKPASNPLPKDVKTLAFVYRNILFDADSITHFYKYNEETFVDTTNYRKEIVQAAYMGFSSVMKKHYPLDTIPLLMLEATKGNAQRNISPLSWKKVNELCSQHNSDILVVLDDIVIFNNYDTWYDGEIYNGVADISSFHSWTVYDPLTEHFIFKETDLDSLQSHETAYDFERLMETKMPRRDEIMEVVAFSVGENLAKKLVPQWTTVYREYYDGGNREMRNAAAKVRAEKWEAALEIWQRVIQEAADKHRARAAFNSAIVYERIGLIDKALVAIQQSINIYKETGKYNNEKQLAVTLQKLLEERQKEVAALKLQQKE